MKLWQKAYGIDKAIETFTIGKDRELDLQLAKYDIQGSLAHGKMLSSIGLLTAEEYEALAVVLKQLYKAVEADDFEIAEGVEDVHSQVEFILTQQLGDIGKKIHRRAVQKRSGFSGFAFILSRRNQGNSGNSSSFISAIDAVEQAAQSCINAWLYPHASSNGFFFWFVVWGLRRITHR